MNQKVQSPEMLLLLVFIVCTALYKQFSYLILCRYITFINFWSLVADRSCCGILLEYFYNICHIRVNYVEIYIFISKLNVAKLPWNYYDVLYHCTFAHRFIDGNCSFLIPWLVNIKQFTFTFFILLNCKWCICQN